MHIFTDANIIVIFLIFRHMKARLLFSILLFLSGVELNAQNTFGDWLKRHETNRREQIVKWRVNEYFTMYVLGMYGCFLTRSVLNN